MTSNDASEQRPALRPATSPRARPAGIVIGALLMVLAIVGARELWVWYAAPEGWGSWILAGLEQARDVRTGWLFWGGIVAFLVGLWFVVAAFKPRVKPYLDLRSDSSVWVRRVDLARFATATAKTLPGVLAASTLVTRKKAVVTATVAHPDDETRARLAEELREALSPLVADRLQLKIVLRHDEELSGPLAGPADEAARVAEPAPAPSTERGPVS